MICSWCIWSMKAKLIYNLLNQGLQTKKNYRLHMFFFQTFLGRAHRARGYIPDLGTKSHIIFQILSYIVIIYSVYSLSQFFIYCDYMPNICQWVCHYIPYIPNICEIYCIVIYCEIPMFDAQDLSGALVRGTSCACRIHCCPPRLSTNTWTFERTCHGNLGWEECNEKNIKKTKEHIISKIWGHPLTGYFLLEYFSTWKSNTPWK